MKRPRIPMAEKVFLIAILSAALGGSLAWADDDVAKVEKLYAEGATMFNGERYQEALLKFEEAYETYPAANLLFNIARCHEAVGKVDPALEAFRRFVAQPGVDSDTKALAERKIRDLEGAKRQANAASQPADKGAKVAVSDAPASQPRSQRRNFSPWHYIALGTGAALVGGGIAAMVLGFDDGDQTKKLVGYILTGAGAAALVTGGVLLVLELTSGEGGTATSRADETSLAFGFAPLPGGGAASIGGRF